MLIEKIETFYKANLSPTQIFILECLYFNPILFEEYEKKIGVHLFDISNLKYKEFIISDGLNRYFITEKGKEFINFIGDVIEDEKISPKIDYFEEFWNSYPSKSGVRALKSGKEKCREKYNKILSKGTVLNNVKVKGVHYHQIIMKALQNEQEARKKALLTGQWMSEWSMITTYINQEKWIGYLESEKKEENGRERRLSI